MEEIAFSRFEEQHTTAYLGTCGVNSDIDPQQERKMLFQLDTYLVRPLIAQV